MSFGGSGDGGSSIKGSTDVTLNNPSDGQILTYGSTEAKWHNVALPSSDPVMGGDISGTASAAQINTGAVGTTELADGGVTEAKLASAVQTKLNATAPVTSVNTKTGAVTLTASDIGAASTGDIPTADTLSGVTTTGRQVMKATDAATARSAIGAGTSNLTLGTTSTTALAGDTTAADIGGAALVPPALMANLPDPSGKAGMFGFATDLAGGRLMQSDGTTYKPVAPGLAQMGGVELASAQLTATYDITTQSSPTTPTDIGLSINVPASAQAYELSFSGLLSMQWDATFTGSSSVALVLRIVDSAVSKVKTQFITRYTAAAVGGGANGAFAESFATVQCIVPAGAPPTSYKVQAYLLSAVPTGVTGLGIYAGPADPAPNATWKPQPAWLTATTRG